MEDEEAVTEEQKLELERERAELALENLIGTETEKAEAKLELEKYYDEKEIELATKTAATITANEEKALKKQEDDKYKSTMVNFKIAKQGIDAARFRDLDRGAPGQECPLKKSDNLGPVCLP